jgi:rhodanese-related sulfurtransferase
VALLLRKKGIKRIRPLEGGLDAWRKRGYPMDVVTIAVEIK